MKNHINGKWFLIFLLMPLLASRSLALVVNGYDSVTNNRFAPEADYTNTVANPAYIPTLNTNAAFIGSGYDFSGVGWNAISNESFNVTLLSPQNELVAQHVTTSIFWYDKLFLGRDGQMLDAGPLVSVYGTVNPYAAPGGDVAIGTHSGYAPSSKVAIYSVMDLGSNPANYIGSPLIMYGMWSKVGTNFITSADSTYVYYSSATNSPGMAYVQGGDSSSPDFIPYIDPITGAKKLSVIGAHYSYGYDPFLPDYWTNINAVMNLTGYSLRWVAPVKQTWTGGAGSGDFTNSVNWSSATPGISNAVLFDIGTAGGQTVINLGGTQTLNGLYFKNSGGNGFTISNGLLAVDRVGIVNGSNGTLVIQSDVAFNAPQNWDGGNGGITVNGTITNNGYLFYVEGTGTNRLNGAIYGAGGLAKDGTGRLIVSGTNILGGSVFVHEGTLELASPFLSSTGSLYVGGSLLLQGGTNTFGGSLYGGSAQGTWDMSLNGGLLVVSNGIRIGSQAGSAGSFTVNGGRLETASGMYVGYGGGGQWNLFGGTNALFSSLSIGNFAGATGAVLMTGGQLVTTNNIVFVGNGGVGSMTVSNGTWLGKEFRVGNNGGAQGTLTFAGGTNLFFSGANQAIDGSTGAAATVWLTGGQLVTTNSAGTEAFYVGSSGVGNMAVSGGTWLSQYVTVGGNAGSQGTLTVTNGTWLSQYVVVGNNGGAQGTLNIAGGTNDLLTSLVVGNALGGTGAVCLTGGRLVTTNIYGNGDSYVGKSGIGAMTVSNGSWLANDITVGSAAGSQGALTLVGGSNVFASWAASLYVGRFAGATGAVTMLGGYLFTPSIYLGTNATTSGRGSFLLSSGGVFEANTLVSGYNGSGVFTNQNGGVLQFTTATPTITTNTIGSIVVTNAVISYRDVAAANIANAQVSNITFQGNNIFRLNNSTNVSVASYLFDTNSGPYQGLQLMGAAPKWQSTVLTIGLGGSLMVTNAMAARVSGLLTNSGMISVMNGAVVYGGNVVNQGAYVSDPSTNTFNGVFTVGSTATVTAAAGDVYAFGSNFVMSSANRTFDMHLAQAVFSDTNYGITTGNKTHTFDLTGSGAVDMGSNGFMNVAQLATNFSVGTLSIALSNNLTVTGTKTGSLTNALYVGWLDLSAWNTNAASLTITLQAALNLTNINFYYDMGDSRNAYLQNASYMLWGGGGLLTPIPEPSTRGLILGGALLSAWLLRRKRQAGMRNWK